MLFLLGGALTVGVLLGRRRAAEELAEDPVGSLEGERLEILAAAQALAPPLEGGPPPSEEELSAVQTRLDALLERSRQLGVPLDTLESQAALARGRFERLLGAGGAGLAEAERLLSSVGHRGEETVLRARLQLARGEDPDESWLLAWADTKDDAVAQAARLLAARLCAATQPERARRLLSERVAERPAKQVLARIEVAAAARALEPDALQLRLSVAGEDAAHAPRLRKELIRRGLKSASADRISPPELIRTLRVIGLLRGDVGDLGQRLAQTALTTLQLRLNQLARKEGLSAIPPEERVTTRHLCEALAGAGLQAGPCSAGAGYLSDLLELGQADPGEGLQLPLFRAALQVALRTDQRLFASQLAVLAPLGEALLASSDPCERALGLRLAGRASQAEAEPLLGALPPAQAAQLLLLVQSELPSGPDRLALCERARGLDPSDPRVSLALWEAAPTPPPSDALLLLGAQLEGVHLPPAELRPFARGLLSALAKLQAAREQEAAAEATRAELERRFGS